MADNIIGGGGGGGGVISSVMQNLLANAEKNQAAQNAAQSTDDGDRDALQQRLAKQALLKQQQHKDHISHDRNHQALRKEALDKRMAPGVLEWASAEALQNKLTAKQKELFLRQAQHGDVKTNQAGSALAKMSQSNNFARAVPTSTAAGQLQAMVMKTPQSAPGLQEAIDSRFMGDRGADGATKQRFLQFAAKNLNAGISVRIGGDMLGSLSGAKLPGFAQRSAMGMIERDPNNVRGVQNVQDFVESAPIRNMPTMARGRATELLAQADGADGVRLGLTEVAESPGFAGLPKDDKARLFATFGQGRASELRAITDRTLVALRTANFPTQGAQVGRFLTGLGRQIQKGSGSHEQIDPKALLRQAKRGNMPAMPKLMPTTDVDDEEAQDRARSHNRAALMRYYTQLGEHYDGIENQIKNAKYFEDVNLLSGLKQAPLPETAGILRVSEPVREDVEGQLKSLADKLSERTLTRPEYIHQVRTLQTRLLGRPDLTADEKTWLGVVTADATHVQIFHDLAGKKNRKLREVGKNLMPAAKRRRLGQERRTVTAQPRYFRLDDAALVGGAPQTRALPLPGRSVAGGGQAATARVRDALAVLQNYLENDGSAAAENVVQALSQAAAPKRAKPQSAAFAKEVDAKSHVRGKTDGWGLQRTFEADLGARAHVTPVRPAQALAEQVKEEGDTPKSALAQVQVVRPTAQLRDLATLYGLPWKDLSKDESNIFRNLGWDHATWDAKAQGNASIPNSMRTPFSKLLKKEQSSVRALGFSPEEWDAQVKGL